MVFLYSYLKQKNNTVKREFPKKYEKYKNTVNPFMIRFNSTGFNNEKIFNEWYDKIFIPYYIKMKRFSKNVILVLDDAKFHSSSSIVDKCIENQIDLLILPGRTTSILQPLDVGVNKPFKDRLRDYYIPWLTRKVTEEFEYQQNTTKSGLLKSPDIENISDWAKTSIENVGKEIILAAFEKTGITNKNRNNEILEKLKINIETRIER